MSRDRCHLCGGSSFKVVYEKLASEDGQPADSQYKITDQSSKPSGKIVSCSDCGLTFVHPFPAEDEVFNSYVSLNDGKYLQEERGRRTAARKVLSQLNQVCPARGRLLDVGCATGLLLDEARKDGWDVYGVEPSEWAVRYVREQLGIKTISQGTLKEAGLPEDSFDAVVMTDVIEHLTEPKKTLQQIRPLLKADGVLWCSTPDVDSLLSRLLKAKWWGIKKAHLFYFNKKILRELFTAAGFTIVKTHSHARTFSLGYWVESLSTYKKSIQAVVRFLEKHPRLGGIPVSLNLGDQVEVFARKTSGPLPDDARGAAVGRLVEGFVDGV